MPIMSWKIPWLEPLFISPKSSPRPVTCHFGIHGWSSSPKHCEGRIETTNSSNIYRLLVSIRRTNTAYSTNSVLLQQTIRSLDP